MNPISLIKKIGFLPAIYKIKRRIFINDESVICNIAILGAHDYLQKYNYVLHHPIETPIANSENLYPDKIWTMWLQGFENAPELIQKCITTVQKQYGDEVIVLTNENIYNFIDIPDFIIEKYKKGIISNTHYADIIRFLIIEKYGGLWLDGTTFLLGEIPDYIRFADIFFYKNINEKIMGSVGVIAAKPHNPIIIKTIWLLLEYWKNENRLVSYSITMLLLSMAINNTPETQFLWKSIPYVDVANKGLLIRKLFDKYDATHIEVIKQLSVIQQLSWKYPKEKYEQQGTFYDELVKKQTTFSV